MRGFGGKSIYMASYLAFAACSESGCWEIQLNNTHKPVQNISSRKLI
jgi:hypothetical protein